MNKFKEQELRSRKNVDKNKWIGLEEKFEINEGFKENSPKFL